MTDSKYFSSKNEERLAYAWRDMKKNTRMSYIPAVKVFFDCARTTPERLSEKDVRNFFSGSFEGSGKRRYIDGTISRTYYRLVIMAAKKFIAVWYDIEKAEKLLSCFESAPNPKERVSNMSGDAIRSYLKVILDTDKGLFVASALAFGACLAPKELFSLKKSSFFEKDGDLCLSVGMGTNHRYIKLPENTAKITAQFLADLMPPKDMNIFEYSCKMAHKASPVQRYNQVLTGLQYRHAIEGIDKKMTLQQFRTIAMSCIARNVDSSLVCDYCAVSQRYPSTVKGAYHGRILPDLLIKNAYESAYQLTDTDLSTLNLRKDVRDDAYIVKYPLEEAA